MRRNLFEEDLTDLSNATETTRPDLISVEEPKGSETPKKSTAPAKPLKPSLDVDVFAKNVARLCINVENLLIVKPVIINRAVAFLEENYGKEYSDSLVETLDRQFGLRIHDDPDVYDVPMAPGAAGKTGA